MHLHIKIGDTLLILPAGENSGALVAALGAAQVHEMDWNGTIKPKAEVPQFSFVDPNRSIANPHVLAANSERDQYKGWWSTETEKTRKLEARVRELEAQATA